MALPNADSGGNSLQVVSADSSDRVAQAKRLFLEYAESLSFKLCFQNFQTELDGLPGDYAPPKGGLWLAQRAGTPIGCIALRPIDPMIAELKRLYVQPASRQSGAGKMLVQLAIAKAVAMGYRKLRLDTTPEMEKAIRLYRSLGFRTIEPYRENPIPGALYMELDLDSSSVDIVRIDATAIETVAELFDAYRQFYGQAPDLAGARQFLTDRASNRESIVFAAVRGDCAVGFTQLYPAFSSVSMQRMYILNDLFVSPTARRMGIGERLLQAAVAFAQSMGACRLELSTAIENRSAQALYEKTGWRREEAFWRYELQLERPSTPSNGETDR